MLKKKNLIYFIAFCLAMISCKNDIRQNKNNITKTDSIVSKTIENTPSQIYDKPEIPVLCYHRISDSGSKSDYKVSPACFSSHMQILADSGYHSISPEQLYNYLVFNKSLPTKPVMITFDDSREEHAEIAAPIMEKLGFKGVFFIMTITYNKKNYMTKDQISELAHAGHTIGLHSWDHTMVTKYNTDADWQKELIEPKKKLEAITGKAVEYWAYPNGVYDHRATVRLNKYIKLSFSLASKRDSLQPLQTIRRLIIPECTPQGLLKSIKRTFHN